MKRKPGFGQAAETETCADKLAHFFPRALPVHIPVQVTTLRPGAVPLQENALVEFGAAEHAIFASSLPLEFDDRVRLAPTHSGTAQPREDQPADAAVVAVQYRDGSRAVAVRFLDGNCRWVSQL